MRASDHTPAQRVALFRAGLNERERSSMEASSAGAAAELARLAQGSAVERRGSVLAAVAFVFALADDVSRVHLNVVQPRGPIACRAGCHWCCHLKVVLSAPELFALAEYLRHQVSPLVFQRVKTRAADLSRDARIFSADEKAEAMIPCPVLGDDGHCSAYAARPMSCRAYNARDPDSCRRMLTDDTEYVAQDEGLARESTATGLGLLDALSAAHLEPELFELTAGLDIALGEPSAFDRWLAGEAIFRRAAADGASERGT